MPTINIIQFEFDPYHPNMNKMNYSARHGEIQIARNLMKHITIDDDEAYQCRLNISNIAEEDDGEWKVVMTARLHVENQLAIREIHEWSQVINVKGMVTNLDMNSLAKLTIVKH